MHNMMTELKALGPAPEAAQDDAWMDVNLKKRYVCRVASRGRRANYLQINRTVVSVFLAGKCHASVLLAGTQRL